MVPELRPRGVGEILDTAVTLYRARFVTLMKLALIVLVPVEIISGVVLLSAQPDGYNLSLSGQATPDYQNQLVQLGASMVVLLVGYVATAFVIALCARPLADSFFERVTDGRNAILGSTPRMAALGAAALIGLCNLLGVFMCGIGLFVTMALLAVAMPALVVERLGAGRSFGRSLSLSAPNFWRLLGAVFTAQMLTSVLNLALASGAYLLFRGGGDTTAQVVARTLSNIVSATLTTPFVAAVAVVAYFDCRIRDEAFDVQLLMQRDESKQLAA